MTESLTPTLNEVEFGDERLVGEWANFLPETLQSPQYPPWCCYAARLDGRVVGLGAFKGSPKDGTVELSYLVLIPERGRGHANAICKQLIVIAQAEGADKIVAHTLAEENASTAVLRHNGFILQRPIEDPEDGLIWAWLRDVRA
jgi:[ribosomal protein S5]-alanine N-acetyltransferase